MIRSASRRAALFVLLPISCWAMRSAGALSQFTLHLARREGAL